MQERPQYLEQEEYCLSKKEAEKKLNEIITSIARVKPSSIKEKKKKNITMKNPIGIVKKFSYTELVNEIRQLGYSSFIQETIDQTDKVFGGCFSISHTMPDTYLKSEWAGYSQTFKGISRIVPSEIDISDDIEFYKEESCIESSEIDLEMTSRNYRGFLFSCISLIDSYINKHIIFKKNKGFNSTRFDELCKSQNCEQRIELFVKLFCEFEIESLKKSRAWTDFKKLKRLRNDITHSKHPYFGIEIKELATNLNLSIHGVGSLLKFLQEGQGRKSLGFIERVRNSKVIYYNEVIQKPDKTFREKKYNKNFKRSISIK